MNIREAFEDYYSSVKPPQDTELRVVIRIERSKRKKLFSLLLFQSLFLFLMLGLFLKEILHKDEYRTFSAGIPVKLAKDTSLKKVSEELAKYGILLEGPHEKGYFLLKGEEEKIKKFLEGSENFKPLE